MLWGLGLLQQLRGHIRQTRNTARDVLDAILDNVLGDEFCVGFLSR